MDDYNNETLPLLVNAKFTLNIQSDGKTSLTIRTDNEDELEQLLEKWEPRIVVYQEHPHTNGKQNGHNGHNGHNHNGAAKLQAGDKCPECNNMLVRRQGNKGIFLGCMSFPGCNFTSSIK